MPDITLARSSGILLHPTSFPGPFGIGDLGKTAYQFADFLVASGQSLWQVLPLGPTSYGDSPYACYSAFAGNTLLISPERLVDEDLLAADEVAPLITDSDERIDFVRVHHHKEGILRDAFSRFKASSQSQLKLAFEKFCVDEQDWLDDYGLFRALKEVHSDRPWNEWHPALVKRSSVEIGQARHAFAHRIEAHKFYQFLFFRQWFELKSYCNKLGIKLIGDIPIFVAQDSSDVWTNPDQFKLDGHGIPTVVAGVPPDYFSSTGQLWGNPI
ncbi:MAG TPA: 4-alpha-glucanotransferase, partial [Pyrinomonadaceae bacterium]|nr:4-alpha-glucanotransferase [Pyrinomonadaceae bacterium]